MTEFDFGTKEEFDAWLSTATGPSVYTDVRGCPIAQRYARPELLSVGYRNLSLLRNGNLVNCAFPDWLQDYSRRLSGSGFSTLEGAWRVLNPRPSLRARLRRLLP